MFPADLSCFSWFLEKPLLCASVSVSILQRGCWQNEFVDRLTALSGLRNSLKEKVLVVVWNCGIWSWYLSNSYCELLLWECYFIVESDLLGLSDSLCKSGSGVSNIEIIQWNLDMISFFISLSFSLSPPPSWVISSYPIQAGHLDIQYLYCL